MCWCIFRVNPIQTPNFCREILKNKPLTAKSIYDIVSIQISYYIKIYIYET